jgi:hypothetical protein
MKNEEGRNAYFLPEKCFSFQIGKFPLSPRRMKALKALLFEAEQWFESPEMARCRLRLPSLQSMQAEKADIRGTLMDSGGRPGAGRPRATPRRGADSGIRQTRANRPEWALQATKAPPRTTEQTNARNFRVAPSLNLERSKGRAYFMRKAATIRSGVRL